MATHEVETRAEQFKRASATWDAAWAKRDFDQMLSIYTDDVVWEDAQVPRPLRGKQELRQYFEAMARAFPDIEIHQEQLFSPIGDSAVHASRWRLRGTFRHAFELPGITKARVAPTGDTVDFTGMVEVTVTEDGRGSHVRQYADSTAFQRQIGAMPNEGTIAFRFVQGVQALGARRRYKHNVG